MTSSQFINVMHGVYFSTGNWNSAGGRMTKCKIVCTFTQTIQEGTLAGNTNFCGNWKNICVGDYGNHRIKR